MANKKISELQSRTPALSDLMLVGDPSSGYSYKCTVTALATIIETDIADGYVTIGTTQTISGAKTFSNNLTLTSVVNTPTDPDKFLTLNASNVVTYRTGAEVLSDIGGVGGSGTTNYLPKFSATTTLANSQIFDNGTNIGIATATPDATARVQINKTDGYGLYLNYNTSTGSGVTTTALYAINTTASSGYAAVIEEKTPNTTAGQYPFVIKHSLSSGTAGVGFGTGVHFQLLDDAGTSKTTQLTIENIDAAAATYKTRYRFNVQNNGSSTPVVYINGTGLGVFTASPSVALDVTGEGKFSTINNATTDTDKFLVSDSGVLKYRTGAEVLSDIGAASSSSISGTTNYLAKFTSSSAVGNSQIFDNGTNVGIGTNTPTRTLDVNGIITTNNNLELTSANPTILWTTSNLRFYNNTNGVVATISSAGQLSLSSIPNATTDTDKFLVSDGGVVKYRTGSEVLSDIGAASSSSISGTTNYIPKFTSSSAIGNSVIYESGGSIGFNTTSPTALIHAVTLGTPITAGAGTVAVFQRNQFNYNGASISIVGGNVGSSTLNFGDADSETVGQINYDHNVNGMIFQTNGSERMRLDASGNLGLGTSSPSTYGKLAVVGAGLTEGYTVNTSTTSQAAWFSQNNSGTKTGILQYGSAQAAYGALGGGEGALYSNGIITLMTDGSGYLKFATGGNTERMRLDASGNLGLGTSSPARKLSVVGSAVFTDGTNDVTIWNDGSIGTNGNLSLKFNTNGTLKATLDASGNLGLGVVPSAFSSSYKAIQFGTTGSIFGESGDAANYYTTNTFIDAGGFKYITTDFALGYFQENGVHSWRTAPSGTAGTAISFTQAMTLNASGNLGLGVSPSAWYTGYTALQVGESASLFSNRTSADTRTTQLANNAYLNTGATNWIYAQTDEATRYGQVSGEHQWFTAPSGTAGNAISWTQAMTLDASGNLNLGTTGNTSHRLVVFSNSNQQLGLYRDANNYTAIGTRTNGDVQIYGYSSGVGYRNILLGVDGSSVGGNVGIGTTSPGYKTEIRTDNQNATQTLLALTNSYGGATDGARLLFQVANTGGNGAAITGKRDGGTFGIDLLFETSSGVGSAATEKMRITSTGNVGIGTTSPSQKLAIVGSYVRSHSLSEDNTNAGVYFQVKNGASTVGQSSQFVDNAGNWIIYTGTSSEAERMRITSGGNVLVGTTTAHYATTNRTVLNVNGTSSAIIGLQAANTTSGYLYVDANDFTISTEGTRNLNFTTAGAAPVVFQTNGSERMRLTSSGELLINTTSDAGDYKLQVNGAIYTNSNITSRGASFEPTTGTTWQNAAFKTEVNNSPYGGGVSLIDGTNGWTMYLINSGANFRLASATTSTTPTTQFDISNSGNAIFSGSIKTAAPSGGTAKPWKFGEAGVTLGGSNTSGVRVEIDGVVYYLVTGYLP